MGHIPNETRTCRHCGIQVAHFTSNGTDWTAWRHSAPCGRGCDHGGCETLDKGHYSLTHCSDPKCPVVIATAAEPERDDLIAKLRRNGITLVGHGPDGVLEDRQVTFAWIGGKDADGCDLGPIRRMCFIDARLLLGDGTEIGHWYDGMEIDMRPKTCGKCGKPPGDHWKNIVVEIPGGQRTALTCTTEVGEYEEAIQE